MRRWTQRPGATEAPQTVVSCPVISPSSSYQAPPLTTYITAQYVGRTQVDRESVSDSWLRGLSCSNSHKNSQKTLKCQLILGLTHRTPTCELVICILHPMNKAIEYLLSPCLITLKQKYPQESWHWKLKNLEASISFTKLHTEIFFLFCFFGSRGHRSRRSPAVSFLKKCNVTGVNKKLIFKP